MNQTSFQLSVFFIVFPSENGKHKEGVLDLCGTHNFFYMTKKKKEEEMKTNQIHGKIKKGQWGEGSCSYLPLAAAFWFHF